MAFESAPDRKAVKFIQGVALGDGWAAEQEAMVCATVDAITDSHPVLWASEIPGELVAFLTGLICLADWMASDEAFLSEAPLALLASGDSRLLREYLLSRQAQAQDHIEKNLGTIPQLDGTFGELFGFEPDSRDIQKWAVDDVACHDGLTIVTVPMGEGKTETALWMHRSGSVKDGIIFGLPTMATSDAMFTRIQTAFRGTPALANLAHGRSILNDFYDPSGAVPTNVCDEDGGLEAGRWFKNGPHRALLAPVTVGTCDQVLAAGVSHRFLPVRLAALASKHIILDEVHTYDPYQDQLLLRLLGWLGAIGARVTLLTATLPRVRRNAYLAAYGDGLFAPGSLNVADIPDAYPAVYWIPPSDVGPVVHMKPITSWRTYRHGVRVAAINGEPESLAAGTAEIVSTLARQYPIARIGVIVNTVDRAIAVARLVEQDDSRSGRTCLLLHSRMTAGERARRTQSLLTDLGRFGVDGEGIPTGCGHSLTVVATQIAEASFDVDFDFLITDICPMPSLLQRMGRQWRHSSMDPSGKWAHDRNPTVLSLREELGGPEVIVVYPTAGDAPTLHPRGHFPYTRAEINAAYGLGLLGLSQITLPDDLQGLVDRCHVDFSSLNLGAVTPGAEGIPEDPDVIEHLDDMLRKQRIAATVGKGYYEIRREWLKIQDPDMDEYPWFGSYQLDALTKGSLWKDDDVQTRMIDSISVTILPYSSDGAVHEYAWDKDPEQVILGQDLTSILGREAIREALAHTVVVSGEMARLLRKHRISGSKAWMSEAPSILRNVVLVSIRQLEEINLTLDAFGLHRGFLDSDDITGSARSLM